jgi:hypothetical protein
MDDQKLAHGHKDFALEVAPQVRKDLEWATKPGEEMAYRC